jgi:hypothetical protein
LFKTNFGFSTQSKLTKTLKLFVTLILWYPHSKEILLNMGSRVIIVVVQVGAVKIYVAAGACAQEKANAG